MTDVTQAPGNYPPSEIAMLYVNGQQFGDWETIWVQHRWADAFAYFRFTAAERDPMPANWTLLQFKPGDECTITLGGQLALTGFIVERQTAYDANNHQVQLIGKSVNYWGYKSSVDTPTGNFDGMNFQQVAEVCLAGYPGAVVPIGSLDPTPFPKLQNQPGESIWDFLERIARPRGIVLGSDYLGNYLLIGQHTRPVVKELIEGVNIKSCQCVISMDTFYQRYEVRAQKTASDDSWGTAASEMKCAVGGNATVVSKLITPAEQPVNSQAEVCARAAYEQRWNEGFQITATVVVYGWLRDGQNLWQAGDNVSVHSPMAMLGMVMKIQRVTFSQDDQSGTQTTLDLVAPWLLGDTGNWNVGNVGAPQAPNDTPIGP